MRSCSDNAGTGLRLSAQPCCYDWLTDETELETITLTSRFVVKHKNYCVPDYTNLSKRTVVIPELLVFLRKSRVVLNNCTNMFKFSH